MLHSNWTHGMVPELPTGLLFLARAIAVTM
jgi:hypothetical protein